MNSVKKLTISKGLVEQLIEQFLESVGKIKHNEQIKLPWPLDQIPLELSKQHEVKLIHHGQELH
jgi:hypothetical protein